MRATLVSKSLDLRPTLFRHRKEETALPSRLCRDRMGFKSDQQHLNGAQEHSPWKNRLRTISVEGSVLCYSTDSLRHLLRPTDYLKEGSNGKLLHLDFHRVTKDPARIWELQLKAFSCVSRTPHLLRTSNSVRSFHRCESLTSTRHSSYQCQRSRAPTCTQPSTNPKLGPHCR